MTVRTEEPWALKFDGAAIATGGLRAMLDAPAADSRDTGRRQEPTAGDPGHIGGHNQPDPLQIHFRRDPRYTDGNQHRAWIEIDGDMLEANGPAALFRLLTMLNDAGHGGSRWTAHDGRMICLRGYVRDFSYDAKNGRAPSRDWYEANIGPYPVPQNGAGRRAPAPGRASMATGTDDEAPPAEEAAL